MDDRIHIAHLINPVRFPVDSELTHTQPLTFESMKRAAAQADDVARIDLLTAQYPEDRVIIPPLFTQTNDLERSVADLGSFSVNRKLPLIGHHLASLLLPRGGDPDQNRTGCLHHQSSPGARSLSDSGGTA